MFDIKEYMKKYYKDNKEKLLKQHKQWIKNNPEYNKQWKKDNSKYIKEYMGQWCKDNPEYIKEYYKENKERYVEHSKQYRKDNLGMIRKCNKQWCKDNPEYMKQWRKNNSEYMKEYQKHWIRNKRKTDLKYNLNSRISRAIQHSLKGNKGGRHWEDLVGYTLKDLIKRLKKTMPNGYNWNDFLNSKLEIDHIIPRSIFDFDNSNQINFKECWSLKNLRLLPTKENRIKHDKLIRPFQLALKI